MAAARRRDLSATWHHSPPPTRVAHTPVLAAQLPATEPPDLAPQNAAGVEDGGRILSSYRLKGGKSVSVSTFLGHTQSN